MAGSGEAAFDDMTGFAVGLGDLDATATLAAATDELRTRRAAEVRELLVAAHWADLHGHPADDDDPMLVPGGEGTPAVREYALPELAMARDVHFHTVRTVVADTLDLRHRLPLTWAKVTALACEPWVARRVAALSRAVPLDAVGVVDRAVATAIARHAPGTVLSIAQAKVVGADPEGHAARRELDRHRRYVSLSRSDEFGYRTIIARVTAGDAAWVDAMVDRVAEILRPTHGHDHNRDELRSLAMGWLARPADLLKLLLDPLAALHGIGVVFVHLTDESLHRQAGVARLEGQGPFLAQALAELLGHADVTVKPVLDLRRRIRADAYEHRDRLKDHVWTSTGGDVFPFSPRTATRGRVDFDPATPFRPNGPPGQTGSHNAGPLRRSHHRWKTRGGYRCRQAGLGRHLWQTPHGLCLLIDHTGTRRLTPDQAEVFLSAPDVEIHFSDVPLDAGVDYSRRS